MFRVVRKTEKIRKCKRICFELFRETEIYEKQTCITTFAYFAKQGTFFSRDTKLVSLEIIENFVRKKLGSRSTTLTVTM